MRKKLRVFFKKTNKEDILIEMKKKSVEMRKIKYSFYNTRFTLDNITT